MKYLIDYTMLYEVDTGTILLDGVEEPAIRLSNQAARLLHALILNNGMLLERDELIKRVWEDQGFSGSSVSLNVAISEIRKAFRMLEHDPSLIMTVRGKGFSLMAHIQHHTVRPKTEATVSRKQLPEEKSPNWPRKDIRNIILIISTIILSIVVSSVVTQWVSNPKQSQDTSLSYAGHFHQCAIYVMNKDNGANLHNALEEATRALAYNKINCLQRAADVYLSTFRQLNLQNSFMGVCFLQCSRNSYRSCVSYLNLTGK